MVKHWPLKYKSKLISLTYKISSKKKKKKDQFSSVQSLSRVQPLRPHGLQHTSLPCPSPTPRACSDSSPLNQWCHPTVSSSVIPFLLPSIFPSIRVLSNESVLHIRRPKYWSLSFSISPSKEHPGLISFIFYFYLDKGFFFFFSFLFFLILKSLILTCVPKHRMDWLDLLAVQGTLKSLLQHHSSKASILWH